MSINRAPWNALVDDDGSNTVGSIWNKQAIKNVLLDPIDVALVQASRVVQRTTLTGLQHDFALTVPAVDTLLLCNNTALLTLDGIAGGVDGQQLTIVATQSQVNLPHNQGSSAANRLYNFATSGATSLGLQGQATYQYDAAAATWRMVSHEQGPWLTVPFVASDYTANGSMTWTVDAGDIFCPISYRLSGKTLTVAFDALTTSVGGTPNYALQIRVPGGFTVSMPGQTTIGALIGNDNGTALTGAYISVAPSGQIIQLVKANAANWTASANNTRVQGLATFAVN